MNGVPLGSAACPGEVLAIKLQDGTYFRVKVFYDTMTNGSLVNDKIHPLVRSTRYSSVPLGITSVNGVSSRVRQMATFRLSDGVKMEAVVLKNLMIDATEIEVPHEWAAYKRQWINNISDYPSVDAKIILGSDASTLHPFNVVRSDGTPVEYKSARLMVSALSGKYLAMGHLGVNHFYPIQYTEFSQDEEGLFYSSPESPLATIQSSDDEDNIQEIHDEFYNDDDNTQEAHGAVDIQEIHDEFYNDDNNIQEVHGIADIQEIQDELYDDAQDNQDFQ